MITIVIDNTKLPQIRLSSPDERYTDVKAITAQVGLTPDQLVWFADHSIGGREWQGKNEVLVAEEGLNGTFYGYRPEDLETAKWTSATSGASIMYFRIDAQKGYLVFQEGHQDSWYLEIFLKFVNLEEHELVETFIEAYEVTGRDWQDIPTTEASWAYQIVALPAGMYLPVTEKAALLIQGEVEGWSLWLRHPVHLSQLLASATR